VKRLLGVAMTDVQSLEKSLSYGLVEKDGRPLVQINLDGSTKLFPPETIAGMILEKMKETAEDFTGQTVKDVVITAPANFSDAQRNSLKAAAAVAKLNVVRIINEPTAAALAYGFQARPGDTERSVVVYDLGGGTFDVTVLCLANGIHEVKTTSGEANLGGDDFDTRLVDHFVAEFKRKTKLDITLNKK